jgi:hypothetical protein
MMFTDLEIRRFDILLVASDKRVEAQYDGVLLENTLDSNGFSCG